MSEVVDLSDRSTVPRVWLVVAAWSVVAATYALILSVQIGLWFPYALVNSAAYFSTLGVAVWVACRRAHDLQLWRLPLVRAVATHAAIGVAALVAWAAVQLVFMRLAAGPTFWEVVYADSWLFQVFTAATTYGAGVVVGLIVQAIDREQVRRRRETQLELAARQGELVAMKAQLQPHFLLNALNSILALIDDDPAEARAMLIRLSSLLHSVFDRLELAAVPLARELETMSAYLEIERIRFGRRLCYEIDADQESRAVSVPPFLLQPIVENAVKHGIEPHAREGHVRIAAARHGGTLDVTIGDTGEGFIGQEPPKSGRGLDLTRRRLAAIYGQGAVLRFDQTTGGFTVHLTLPIDSSRVH